MAANHGDAGGDWECSWVGAVGTDEGEGVGEEDCQGLRALGRPGRTCSPIL